jgi:hypothetical protein
MAHFAELNSSSVVLQVVVISNDDVDAHGGDESTEAEDFVKSLVPYSTGGTSWKQTSYNNNFRKQYAGIGFTYDASKDMFIVPKPYASWSLDSSGDWVAPVAYPNEGEEGGKQVFITWDEDNLRWVGSTFTGTATGETKYRWDASALNWVAL